MPPYYPKPNPSPGAGVGFFCRAAFGATSRCKFSHTPHPPPGSGPSGGGCGVWEGSVGLQRVGTRLKGFFRRHGSEVLDDPPPGGVERRSSTIHPSEATIGVEDLLAGDPPLRGLKISGNCIFEKLVCCQMQNAKCQITVLATSAFC